MVDAHRKRSRGGWWLVLAFVIGATAQAAEWSGYIAGETRLFPSPPRDDTQHEENLSLSFQAEFYHEWEERRESVLFVPFLRLDQHDAERTHADVRELYWQKSAEEWELRLGIRKVYWGVTESQHLVDIINQTDMVENLDAEDKLGQLMLNYAWVQDWGTLDFFLLPGCRERPMPGREGRLRAPYPIEFDDAEYESGAAEWHTDWAIRWSRFIGQWDLGLSHFSGTSREPRLLPRIRDGHIRLIPYYDQINQTGLDVQWTHGSWLWKLETIHRSGQKRTYTALTAGLEYTLYGIFESNIDMGLIFEYLYDSRGDEASTPFENDLFFGTRFSFNDVQTTNILAGAIVDGDSGAVIFGLEAQRRLGQAWKLSVESRIFAGIPPSDVGNYFRKDDLIQIELAWYF